MVNIQYSKHSLKEKFHGLVVVSHHQCGDDLSGGNSVGELLRSHCRTVSVIGDIFTTILETNYAIVQSVFTIYIHPMEKIHILSSPKLPSPSTPFFMAMVLGSRFYLNHAHVWIMLFACISYDTVT